MKKEHLKKPKTYEQFLHDIVLWWYNKDKRPTYVESPIDADNWIVTVDFKLLGFDKSKNISDAEGVSQICIHPASLIQPKHRS